MLSTGRYEIKYVVHGEHYRNIAIWLSALRSTLILHHPPRRVHSLYFDTFGADAVQQNIDGLDERDKVRIRWYGELSSRACSPQFELKSRRGGMGYKSIVKLRKFDGTILDLARNWPQSRRWVLADKESGDCIIGYLSNRRPVFVVSYDRSYYKVAGRNIRVTFDSQLSYTNGRICRGGHNPFITIVEVKFRLEERYRANEIMQQVPYRQTRMSKFVIGASVFL